MVRVFSLIKDLEVNDRIHQGQRLTEHYPVPELIAEFVVVHLALNLPIGEPALLKHPRPIRTGLLVESRSRLHPAVMPLPIAILVWVDDVFVSGRHLAHQGAPRLMQVNPYQRLCPRANFALRALPGALSGALPWNGGVVQQASRTGFQVRTFE